MFALDRLDIKTIAALQEALNVLQNDNSIVVRTITFDIYDEHRIRASRRSRWNPLRITKIERIQ